MWVKRLKMTYSFSICESTRTVSESERLAIGSIETPVDSGSVGDEANPRSIGALSCALETLGVGEDEDLGAIEVASFASVTRDGDGVWDGDEGIDIVGGDLFVFGQSCVNVGEQKSILPQCCHFH